MAQPVIKSCLSSQERHPGALRIDTCRFSFHVELPFGVRVHFKCGWLLVKYLHSQKSVGSVSTLESCDTNSADPIDSACRKVHPCCFIVVYTGTQLVLNSSNSS